MLLIIRERHLSREIELLKLGQAVGHHPTDEQPDHTDLRNQVGALADWLLHSTQAQPEKES